MDKPTKKQWPIAGFLLSQDKTTISFPADIDSWFPGHIGLTVDFDEDDLPLDWSNKKVTVTIKLEEDC